MKVILGHDMVCSILKKMGGYYHVSCALHFYDLYRKLDQQEMELIKHFLELDPYIFGFRGEFFGIKGMPVNLVPVVDQKYKIKSKKKIIKTQYLPVPVWVAYDKMRRACVEESGKRILVNSGYRSPAYQVLTFFHYMKMHKFDFQRTVRGVAFPGYSEHGNPRKQGIDFMTIDGVPSDDNPNGFEKTREFKWLSKRAENFGFAMSYPPNNSHGIKFEPWHWRYEGIRVQ